MSETIQVSETQKTVKSSAGMAVLIDVVMIAVISSVVSLALFKYVGHLFNPQQERAQIAVANYDSLVREYIMGLTEQVTSGALPVAEMPTKSASFTQQLYKLLQAHAEAGTTVIRSDAVIAASDDIADITEQLRNDLVAAGLLKKEPPKTMAPTAQ